MRNSIRKMTALLLTVVMCLSLCADLAVHAQETDAGIMAGQPVQKEESDVAEQEGQEEPVIDKQGEQAAEEQKTQETEGQKVQETAGQKAGEALERAEEQTETGKKGEQEKNEAREEEIAEKTERRMSVKSSASELHAPRIEADSTMTAKQKVTWDCVWFGSYPQSEVTSSDPVYSTLQSTGGWDNNEITIGGNRYRRMKKGDATYSSSSSGYYNWPDADTYHYFKYEPVKWRVLKTDGNQALLLSDVALDDQRYNTVYENVTWETSTIRSWLNGYGSSYNQQGIDYSGRNFIDSAFTSGEKSAIADTSVVNAGNLSYGTEGGKDTVDKIFLLSESEVYGESAVPYGFVSAGYTYDEARRSKGSNYAKAMGLYSYTGAQYNGNCYWWLRSPGDYSYDAAYVLYSGFVYYWYYVNYYDVGVRAALNLNLSSNQWNYAGTVCSDGTINEEGGGSTGGDPEPGDESEYDNSKIEIRAADYESLGFDHIEGAKAEVEGIGEAVTNAEGKAFIPNTLSEPSAMRQIKITKEGYRDYIFYTTLVSPDIVSIFQTNQLQASLKKKKTGDDMNPYVSTVMYYSNEMAKSCGGQNFGKTDRVTFRACGVWNGKTPGYYCMYQGDPDGNRIDSEDGIFKVTIGDIFSGRGDIFVKMVAQDGTESEPEQVHITVPEDDVSSVDDSYVPIMNDVSESGWQTDVPFLNNDKLSFDLGKLKTTIKRDGSKVRIMLGAEGSKDIFEPGVWEDWKKFCESQPVDLSSSQWSNVVKSDNLDTSWTAGAKIKATGYGWLENDMSADTETPLTGGIQVIIDMSTSFKQQYAIGVVPVYMEQSIGVNGKLDSSVTFNMKEKKFGGSTSLTVTPSLSVGGGVGVLYAVTIGAEGSASMPVTIDFPKGLTQADLKGAISLKASVLGFSYSKELANATYNLYKADQGKTIDPKSLSEESEEEIYDMEHYSLPGDASANSKWHGEQKAKAAKASSAKSNLTEMLLETGTSELTEPMLVQQGRTTVAVFLTEDSTRSTIHRTKLVYTVYDKDSGSWSRPRAVEEDGTGDFQPYLTASEGGISVSWLNYADTVNDSSSMKEALESSEFVYAVWEESTGSFKKASKTFASSSTATYNSLRTCMDASGNIAEVGLKNTGGDIFGVSGDNILFMSGKNGSTAIEKEFTLSQRIPVSYDITAEKGVVTAAVCVDIDQDLTTLEDREIYLFSSDGKTSRLTNDETFDSAPQYAEYQGKTALFWYTDRGYQILDSSGGQSTVLEEDVAGISDHFTVVNGDNKETAIVWSGVDKEQVYQLAACLYDSTSGKWSRQVILSDSEENIFRPSGYYNADGTMEFLYRKGDTAKKGSLYALQVAQAPDLEIVDAYIKDGTEIPGKTTKVYIGVRNPGTKKITQYTADIDGRTTSGTTDILPGESALIEADYAVPEKPENAEITIRVTVNGDRDTSNNTFKLKTGYADLSIAATEDVFENGKIVHVAVTNAEAVPTDAVLEIHKDAEDGELVSSENLGTLKQGDIIVKDFSYQRTEKGYGVDSNGLYYVVTSSVVEKYDSNNYDYTVFREKEITSGGTEKPDPGEIPGEKPSGDKKPVVSAPVKVKGIRISGISKKIAAGKKVKLTADIMPSNAAIKAVTWTSSNKKVATVNSAGVVTMKKKSGGKSVTITVTAQDGSGVKATYKIKAMKGVVKKVAVSGRKSVKAGKSLKLTAKVKASKGANKKLAWKSNNTKYATVTGSGKVKTKKAGKGKKVKITAMATDGSGKKKTVTIKLK